MRTRRSWRNQERLWRILGNVKKKPKVKRTKLMSKAEANKLIWQRFDEKMRDWQDIAQGYKEGASQ